MDQSPLRIPESKQRRRVLFVAEAVTLAHVARPYALARDLDPAEWEVVFACADTYLRLFPDWPWQREIIHSVAPEEFMRRLAGGGRLYSFAELERYVTADLSLLDRVRPDVLVGDFRLSLSVSARLAGVPYVALSNAYWSPYATHREFPIPYLPMTRYLGLPLASTLFRLARPTAFAWHALPLNLLRRAHGLPTLGLDLRRVYTDADITLYADIPELVPTHDLPDNHRYIGPVEWSPRIAMPPVPARAKEQPLVYVTMGSSGSAGLLPTILDALSTIDCHVAVATAGMPLQVALQNVTVADYLPGREMSAQASLVVCNGGSPTSLQALAHGVPVLGIPFNLDQHLNMEHVVAYGAGLALRAEKASVRTLNSAAKALLDISAYSERARELATIICASDAGKLFERSLLKLLEATP